MFVFVLCIRPMIMDVTLLPSVTKQGSRQRGQIIFRKNNSR